MDLQTRYAAPLDAAPSNAFASAWRRLGWALAASLAVHVLLFWPQPAARLRTVAAREAQDSRELRARLMPGSVAPPAPSRAAATPRDDPAQAVPPAHATGAPSADQRVSSGSPEQKEKVAIKQILTKTRPDRPMIAQPGAAAPAEAPAAAVTPTAAAGGGTPAGAREPQDEPAMAVDGEALRSYRMGLALSARRLRLAQARAVDANGIVRVRLAMGAGGLLREVSVAQSSGDAALDRDAAELVRAAAQATAVPAPLRGNAFALDMPVEFSAAPR